MTGVSSSWAEGLKKAFAHVNPAEEIETLEAAAFCQHLSSNYNLKQPFECLKLHAEPARCVSFRTTKDRMIVWVGVVQASARYVTNELTSEWTLARNQRRMQIFSNESEKLITITFYHSTCTIMI